MLKKNNFYIAKLKYIKGSVSKTSLVANLIRGMNVSDALKQLNLSNKSVAFHIGKTLNSAISNAKNIDNQDVSSLFIQDIKVGKAMTLKRVQPRARGSMHRRKKHFSKIHIYLSKNYGSKN